MARKLLLFIALSAACCIILGVYAMSSHPAQNSQRPQLSPPPFLLPEISIGNPDAPHKVIMYFALDCAHCHDYEKNTLPRMKARFIDTGQVHFILRDFSNNPVGFLASKVSWAQRDPQHYLAMVEKLFAKQEYWNVPDNYKERLQEVSELAEDDFNACINDEDLEHAILWQHLQAKDIKEVPTFIVDGEPIKEILTPEVFISLLAKKQKDN